MIVLIKMNFTINLNIIQLISVAIFSILGYIVIKLIFFDYSYTIVKPFKWETAVKEGNVSKELLKLEKNFVDKVRFYSLWLIIEKIKEKEISGYFAEVGVYKGETAKLINIVEPARKFLLIDTFDGFTQVDLDSETTKGGKYSAHNFSDTSIEIVSNYIGKSENLIFIPGHFPESISDFDVEIKYAFVHIDADLYMPTKEALKYFYPKLSEGGVIVIHDYNHNWQGVKQAVDEYCMENSIAFVEVADMQGSVVITK